MSEFSVSLAKLAEEANLTIAYTPCELDKIQVTATEVYRPGILLAGYYENFDSKRIQIIGLTEMSYLDELSTSLRNTHLEKLFSFQPPAIVLTRGMQPLSEMMQFAKQYGVPILMSTEMTSALMGQLITTLNTELAPRITRHGVLVEVYGEGILILGDSGVGKSETAIELVKRGHRLIADDAVELRRVSYRKILGTAPANIRHFIELRGIGIINVARVFGIGSVRSSVEVEMVVQLEPWDRTKNYDRTGLETEYYDILGVKVPSMLIPVMPGRNLAVILETAAMIGVAGTGAAVLGYTGYMIGTELYLNTVLPAGAAIPNNAGELALLLWEAAGTPAPAALLPADAAPVQQALAWAIENQLLAPDASAEDSVSRWEVIRSWNQMKG